MNIKSTDKFFYTADILLPKANVDLSRYSVIACDQYTSEPEYWQKVSNCVCPCVSCLDMILPEVYLSNDNSERIKKINESMQKCAKTSLDEYKDTFVYVKRVLPSNGKIRHGIVGCIDLEDYSFEKGSSPKIRATEGTVLSRIPPRVEIRKDAILEFPHVMLFCDDKENKIFSSLESQKEKFDVAYDFELMNNSGKITGYFVKDDDADALKGKIAEYACGREIVFAVGDGNHSLATAKTCYENLKAQIGDEALNSPCRYALCEIVNIHDEAVEFEPIYRTVKLENPNKLLEYIKKNSDSDFENDDAKGFKYFYYTKDGEGAFTIKNPTSSLPVGQLQGLLDEFLKNEPDAEIDYIHGVQSLKTLCKEDGVIGFIFDGMRKDELFSSVLSDGALPRKTFSMGSADDKRFYLEGRYIK